jgi:hypothetical protein
MPGYNTHRKLIWKLLAVVCCILIACAAGVQAAHIHTGGETAQSLCALCHIAHVAVDVSIPLFLLSGLVVVAGVISLPPPVRIALFSAFSFYTRPPPAGIAFA